MRTPLSLVAVGDTILLHPISAHMTDPASAGILEILRGADVAIANCEFNGFDPAAHPGAAPHAESGGLYLNAGQEGLADLKVLGFNMLSRGNNHAMDFGVAGMQATDCMLRELGIAFAGTGSSLETASAPAYLATPAGLVALVSATDTAPSCSRASHPSGDMPGRPGINTIRHHLQRVVEPAIFQALQAVLHAATLRNCYLGRPTAAHSLRFLSNPIKQGETFEEAHVLSSGDVQLNLEQVRLARAQADHVIFALHDHLPRDTDDEPEPSIRALAHAVVDAGADVILMHGAHGLRGIEIYNGAPIFYGLGTFVCHLPKIGPQPIDVYERFGVDPSGGIAELLKNGGFFSTLLAFDGWWESAIARMDFDGGRIAIELHPVELARHATGHQLGTPRLAKDDCAARIVERVARLSAPFGTRVLHADGTGRIEVAPS
jgi:hypothetical protein